MFILRYVTRGLGSNVQIAGYVEVTMSTVPPYESPIEAAKAVWDRIVQKDPEAIDPILLEAKVNNENTKELLQYARSRGQ